MFAMTTVGIITHGDRGKPTEWWQDKTHTTDEYCSLNVFQTLNVFDLAVNDQINFTFGASAIVAVLFLHSL